MILVRKNDHLVASLSNFSKMILAEDLRQVNSIITKEDLKKFDVTIIGFLTSNDLCMTFCVATPMVNIKRTATFKIRRQRFLFSSSAIEWPDFTAHA